MKDYADSSINPPKKENSTGNKTTGNCAAEKVKNRNSCALSVLVNATI